MCTIMRFKFKFQTQDCIQLVWTIVFTFIMQTTIIIFDYILYNLIFMISPFCSGM